MMSQSEYIRWWRAHRRWMSQLPAQIIFTGHVHLKKMHSHSTGNSFYESVTVEKLEKYIGYFIKKLSRSYFGTKAIDEGLSLSYMGSIEGGLKPNSTGEPRLHTHLGIAGIPNDADLVESCERACLFWEQGYWGYRDTLAEPCYNEAWKNYSLKKLSPTAGERFITNVPYREPN